MNIFHYLREMRFEKEMLLLPRSVKRISLVFLLYVIGWGVALPYFPVYLKHLFGEYSAVGLITSAQHVFALAWALILGGALDKINKKNLISIILTLYLPFSWILLSLKTIVQFLLFRMYHGAIATSLWLTSEAYLRAHTPEHKHAQAMGLFYFSTGVAKVAGSLIGAGLILYLGFDVLYSISAFAAIALFASYTLPDHKKAPLIPGLKSALHFKAIKKELTHYAKKKTLRKLTIFTFPFFFVLEFLAMSVPLFVESIGASLPMIGLVSAMYNLPTLFQSYFSTLENHKRTLSLGLVFATGIFLALFFTKSIGAVFTLTILLGVALSAVNPILLGTFTPLMPKKKVGEYSAVLFATKSIAAMLSPLIAGFVADAVGLRYVFLMGFAICALLFALQSKALPLNT